MTTPELTRLTEIDTRLGVLRDQVAAAVKARAHLSERAAVPVKQRELLNRQIASCTTERKVLMEERSEILMGITWAERLEYEKWLVSRAAAPLDQHSAVRAKARTL